MLSTGVDIQAIRPPQRWLLALLCIGGLMFSSRLSYAQGYILRPLPIWEALVVKILPPLHM